MAAILIMYRRSNTATKLEGLTERERSRENDDSRQFYQCLVGET
jgi:hypothetical protein